MRIFIEMDGYPFLFFYFVIYVTKISRRDLIRRNIKEYCIHRVPFFTVYAEIYKKYVEKRIEGIVPKAYQILAEKISGKKNKDM